VPETQRIPLDKIMEPHAPARFEMDEVKLQELVESFQARGQLQAIGVFPVGEQYEISYGHRRYKAAIILGWKEIDAKILPADVKARYGDMMDENLCREDITAAEEAVKYQEIIEELNCTEDELLQIAHKPASYVYARLDLLKKNKEVFEAVARRQIVLSVAQQLNRVDNEQHCRYLLHQAIEGGASARVVMNWVVDYKRNGPGQTVSLEPLREAGAAVHAAAGPAACVLCGSNKYAGNMVWEPMHDFCRDGVQAQLRTAGDMPATEEVQP
jgi:ParB/RepB/Spo0J family partition protein